MLGLHCCLQAFSGCGEQGLCFIAVCGHLSVMGGFSCEAYALRHIGFSSCDTGAYLLQGMWNLPQQGIELSPLPAIGRQIPNHWTTREVLLCFYFFQFITDICVCVCVCVCKTQNHHT